MKRKSILVVMAASLFIGTAAVGCSGNDKSTEISSQNNAKENTYKVTFYDADGKTVLEEKEVNNGECIESFEPQKEGETFVGWFATPQMNHYFDFSEEITADTEVFAGFVTYQEDKRGFAILGNGKSTVLKESNWGNVIGDAQKMTKENKPDVNSYTITVDLEEGDEFQFAIDTSTGASWMNQRGYGYMSTISKDGKEYFANSGGLGETSTKRSNIKCVIPGKYTFTLTTYPGEDVYETDNANYSEDNKEAFNINPYDTITWTYSE